MLKQATIRTLDTLGNLLSKADMNYVTEPRKWAVYQVGECITRTLRNKLRSRTTTTVWGLRNSTIHFGSLSELTDVHPSNKVVVSCFHIAPNDARVDKLRNLWQDIDIVHVTNDITKNALLGIGASSEKIVKIPLGIDLEMFKPYSEERKQLLRKAIGAPKGAKVIGSFQKDGAGWDNGNKPKWVKAPEVLVDVLSALNQKYSGGIFVLLSGAARGYVIKGIEEKGVPYKYVGFEDYNKLPIYYNMLDLYIVTSRIEGGPKAILESMASGVPIVSTRCGMAPEVIRDGENGLLADVDDKDTLIEKSLSILEDSEKAQYLVENGLKTVQDYSWDKIAERYYNEIYKELL